MTAPTSARWDLLCTGSVVADSRSRTVAVNVETVHADDMPELLDVMGQALRWLDVDPDAFKQASTEDDDDLEVDVSYCHWRKCAWWNKPHRHPQDTLGGVIPGGLPWEEPQDVTVGGFADMGSRVLDGNKGWRS